MVPGAQLYARATAHAISCCQRQYKSSVRVEGDLRKEILHWRFVDTWTECVPWRSVHHKVVQPIASDASQSRWGVTLSLHGNIIKSGDYFDPSLLGQDIATKEARALLRALQTFSSRTCTHGGHSGQQSPLQRMAAQQVQEPRCQPGPKRYL